MTDFQPGLILPQIYLIVFAVLALFVGVRSAPDGWLWHSVTPAAMAIVGLILAIEAQCVHLLAVLPGSEGLTVSQLGGALIIDPAGAFAGLLCAFIGLLVVLLSLDHFKDRFHQQGPYFCLLLLLVCVSSLIVYASTIVAIGFLVICHSALQILLQANRGTGNEATARNTAGFALLVAAGFLCCYSAIGILRGFGSLELVQIAVRLSVSAYSVGSPGALGLFLLSVLFLMLFCPLMPDIWRGWWRAEFPAALAITLLAGTSLSVLCVRMFAVGLGSAYTWCIFVSVAAFAAMIMGTWFALRTSNLQLMVLANSLVQAGFVLTAVAVLAGVPGISSVRTLALLDYAALSWLLATIGTGTVATALERFRRETGVTKRWGQFGGSRWLSGFLVVTAWSLVGLPPTCGFSSRLEILSLAWQSGLTPLRILVCTMVAVSVISVYYFGIAAKGAFANDPPEYTHYKTHPCALAVSGFCSFGVIALFFTANVVVHAVAGWLWISLAVR